MSEPLVTNEPTLTASALADVMTGAVERALDRERWLPEENAAVLFGKLAVLEDLAVAVPGGGEDGVLQVARGKVERALDALSTIRNLNPESDR